MAGDIRAAVCKIGDNDCGNERRVHSAKPPSQQEWGNRPTDPGKAPPPPTDDERKTGKRAADHIRDYLNGCEWWRFWSCWSKQPPKDILASMSPGEIQALFDELSDDEIRRLLRQPGVVDVLRFRADPWLLHQLERIAPGSIEPNFTEYYKDEKNDNPAIAWGPVQNARVWGDSGLPSLEDLNQGGLGDCWWLSSMGALAQTPEGRRRLRNMIRQNPNGTYTVTFPDGDQVTVTPYFPINRDGNLSFSQPEGQPPTIWPLILEKAFAQKEGGFDEINGGDPARGMEVLTGHDSDSEDADDVTRQDLENWLNSGRPVVVSTKDDVDGKEIYQQRLHADHAYVVKGITKDGKVELFNPWGYDHATLTMEEFNRYLAEVDIGSFE
ncbi:C2 family cysteine protease [Actinomadura sp. NBRC 104425]|uniref:C2 family cysteine protease n=1 Tax=Actinomadura sp. NBRC 104425 TaxID=3032204 RepID=UPI0025525CF3|nr:C2 family cysteine protease [Actinomadura sp. NBRC 104425]